MQRAMWKRMIVGCATLAAMNMIGKQAEAGPSLRRASSPLRLEATEHAAAALTPVGAAAGWGRIKIEDSVRNGVAKREVEVDLFDMDRGARFSIEVDGIVLGSVTTDSSGWASLKLESNDDSHLPVPSGLPAASQLSAASVRDQSGAFVLEGSFVRFLSAAGGDGSVHEEKISLTDQQGIGAAGVAKVERESSGQQEFDSRATGLEPGASYIIRIDGFTAGMVTADAIGQARRKLESPDDSDPLPADLQPIENLRVVEWLDAGGFVVLAGVFTGVSNDDGPGDDNGGNGDDDGPGDDNGGNGDGPGDDNGGNGDDDGPGDDNGDNGDDDGPGDDNGGNGDDDGPGDDNGGNGDDDGPGDDNGGNGDDDGPGDDDGSNGDDDDDDDTSGHGLRGGDLLG